MQLGTDTDGLIEIFVLNIEIIKNQGSYYVIIRLNNHTKIQSQVFTVFARIAIFIERLDWKSRF